MRLFHLPGLLLAAAWPAARRRLGLLTPLLGLATIALVPLTMTSGQWLKDRVFGTPLIETHATLGSALWPWSLALGLLGIATWLWYVLSERRAHAGARGENAGSATPAAGRRRTVGVILAVLAFGTLLHPAMAAAQALDATVADMKFVKPLDIGLVLELARTHQALVTVEEGVVMGGAGSAVAEALAEAGLSLPLLLGGAGLALLRAAAGVRLGGARQVRA